MKNLKTEINSARLDLRIYVNENFAQFNFDDWLLKQLEVVSGLTVLDLGCGTGKHLFKISELVTANGKVVGLDISKESLKKCKHKINEQGITNIELYHSDLIEIKEKVKIKEQITPKFDRILSSFAIYYTGDENKTLEDCYDLLNKGGILFFCGPAKGNNAQFLQLVEEAGGRFSTEFIKWSNFLEDKALPLLKRIFGDAEVVIFENPIEFPNEEILFNYWKATELYDPKIEEAMRKIIGKKFKKEDKFVNKKIILGLRCKK